MPPNFDEIVLVTVTEADAESDDSDSKTSTTMTHLDAVTQQKDLVYETALLD